MNTYVAQPSTTTQMGTDKNFSRYALAATMMRITNGPQGADRESPSARAVAADLGRFLSAASGGPDVASAGTESAELRVMQGEACV